MNNTAQKNIKSELKFVCSENNTLSIIFQNNDLLLGVIGEFNNNLKDSKSSVAEKLKNKNRYISFADIFSTKNISTQYLSMQSLISSNLFDGESSRMLIDSLENFNSINNKRISHNKNYIRKNKNNSLQT